MLTRVYCRVVSDELYDSAGRKVAAKPRRKPGSEQAQQGEGQEADDKRLLDADDNATRARARSSTPSVYRAGVVTDVNVAVHATVTLSELLAFSPFEMLQWIEEHRGQLAHGARLYGIVGSCCGAVVVAWG